MEEQPPFWAPGGTPKGGTPKGGGPKGGGPKGGGLKGGGLKGGGLKGEGPKISRFSSLSRHHFGLFVSLWGFFWWNFGGV